MNNIKRRKIKKFSSRTIILLALLICSQYIITGIHIGKEIIGAIQKRNVYYLCNKCRRK